MDSPEPTPSLCPKNMDLVTQEKIDFVEVQCNALLDFVIASRAVLTTEAHSTMNWHFGVIVGGLGFLVSNFSKSSPPPWWVTAGIAGAMLTSMAAAWLLLKEALRPAALLPKGNEPRNLLTDEALEHSLPWVKLKEISSFQQRIDSLRGDNRLKSEAIIDARRLLTLIPVVAMIFSLITLAVLGDAAPSIDNQSRAADSAAVE